MTLYLSLIKNQIQYWIWLLKKKPFPPHAIYKRKRIITYGKKFICNTFIETGTADGKTLLFVRKYFDHLMSVEVYPPNYEIAKKRLSKYSNIKVILGDSALVLNEMIDMIDGRCLFWLDGHYSGGKTGKGEIDTPIEKELHQISQIDRNDHIILIDDAHSFKGEKDYPSINTIKKSLYSINPSYNIEITMDCIIATI